MSRIKTFSNEMSRLLKTIFRCSSRNFKFARCYSANTSLKRETQEKQQLYEAEQKADENTANKPAARVPLVKSFFIAAPDKELLAFSEVIQRDDMETFKQELVPTQSYFKASEKDVTSSVSSKDLENARDLGLFALNVPKEYDGKGYEWSQSLLASEPETSHVDLALRLLPHRIIVDLLKYFGTEDQKSYFLPQMAKGSLIGTEALIEPNLIESNVFTSKMDYDAQNKLWFLTGEKPLVKTKPLLEKDSKNLFLVLSSNSEYKEGYNNPFAAALTLVEGSQATVEDSADGSRQPVKFENVKLERRNILGDPSTSMQITEIMLKSNRLRCAIVALGLAQQVTNVSAQHFIYKNMTGVPIKDLDLAKIRMGTFYCNTYAIESMIYYTSGLMDEFFQPDVVMEVSATKLFALRSVMDMVFDCNNYLGLHNTDVARIVDAIHLKCKELCTTSETMDSLSFFIGMNGLQYAGTLMQDVVTKSRNPLFNPRFVISKLFEGNNFDNPKIRLGLHENLHPSLATCAQCIEQSLARLHIGVEILLSRNGNEIVDRHEEIKRLATISAELFAMWCSTSRASRSYCIGHQNSDNELLTASAICVRGRDKIKVIVTDIINGPLINNDNNFLRLSKHVTKCHGYIAAHPLSYNY